MDHLYLDKDTITKAYARWAPVYDLVFGTVFERGRAAAIAAAERVGSRILEVGVGTGISLPDYKRTTRLCSRRLRRTAAEQIRSPTNAPRCAPAQPAVECRAGCAPGIPHPDFAAPGLGAAGGRHI